MRSVKRIFEEKRMSFEELCDLILQISEICSRMSSYLLEESRFLLDPGYIYRDLENDVLHIIYLPFDYEESEKSYQKLSDFFLEKIDHKDERSVNIAYNFYKMAKEPLFSLEGFCALIEKEKTHKSEINTNRELAMPDINEPTNSSFEEDSSNNIESFDNHNTCPKYKNWLSALISGVFAVLLYSGYIVLSDVSIYASYLAIMAIILGVVTIGLLVRNIIVGICIYREGKLEIPIEPVSIDDYWGDALDSPTPKGVDKVEAEDEDEDVTQFFDVSTPKEVHFIKWTEDGVEYNKEIKTFPLLIGKKKEETDCVINDVSISRKHASLDERFGKLYLKDCKSTNGVYVNGSRIKPEEEVEITQKDEIYFGKVPVTVV